MSSKFDRYPQQVEKTEKREKEITEKELFTFLFESFRYSQGSAKLQKNFFIWFWIRYPDYTVPLAVQENVVDRIVAATQNMVDRNRHAYVVPDAIKKTANDEMEIFVRTVLEQDGQTNTEIILETIAREMLEQDQKHLDRGREYTFVSKIKDGTLQSNSVHFQKLLNELRLYFEETLEE